MLGVVSINAKGQEIYKNTKKVMGDCAFRYKLDGDCGGLSWKGLWEMLSMCRNVNYGNIEKFVILVIWKGHCLGIVWYLLLRRRELTLRKLKNVLSPRKIVH